MAPKNDNDKDLPGPVEAAEELVDRLDKVPDDLAERTQDLIARKLATTEDNDKGKNT